MKLSARLAQGLYALVMVVTSLVMTPRIDASTTPLNKPYTSVQLFKWSWNDIATECTQFLGPQGYGGVQISPPMAAVTDGFWYGMYQPVNYTSLTSQMGTAAQLQAMINTCHAAGVRVYADIVTNQMAGGSSTSNTATDGSTWDSSSLTYPNFSSTDFHPYCLITTADYNDTTDTTGTYDVQHCWLDNMPDLATENSHVQSQIENYMELLIGMGVDGFRLDAAKHQQEDQLALIFAAVAQKYPQTLEGEPLFVTQEIVPDAEVNRTSYEALGTINEFQFTYAMRDAFRKLNSQSLSSIPIMMGTPGNWGGSSGFLPSASAQVFINNWDTERDDNATDSLNASHFVSGDPNDSVGSYSYDLANILMLTQPYAAMAQVQSGFRFTDVNQDMPSTSPFVGGVAQVPSSYSTPTSGWDFIHRRPDIANMVAFRTATNGLGESNRVTGTNNQVAFSRDNVGFVALNNDTTAWQQTFQTGLAAGTYCNVVNGTLSSGTCTADTVTVDGSGNAVLNIPANGGSVVPAVVIYTAQTQTTAASSSPYSTMYLRGDMDSWGATSAATMTLVSNDTWQITFPLTAGTTYNYKFDASGTWTLGEQWGDSGTPGLAEVNSNNNLSFTPVTSGNYVFTFNDTTLAYSISAAASSAAYSTMYLRGDMNSWGTTAMTLISNDQWQATVTLTCPTTGCTSFSYKYDASGNWSSPTGNWGDSTPTGAGLAAVDSSTNLSYTPAVAGNYVFSFNDSTLTYSVTASTAAVVVPAVPTGLAATLVSTTGLTLNWTASSGATSYNVYRSTVQTGPFITPVGTATTNSYTDTGLTASTTYYYEVAAVNSAGASANSSALSATTSAPSAYTSPYSTMYLRGDMNTPSVWVSLSNSMTLVANDTWQVTATLTPSVNHQFKFDASGTWASGEQWGDSGTAGLAEVNSNNNLNYEAGTGVLYLFTFNDSTLAYSVVPALTPSFTVAVAPNVLFVTAGKSNTTTVTLSPVNGFNTASTITLSCSGLPTGATCSFSPTTVDTAGNIDSTLTVNAPSSVALHTKSGPFLPGSALALAMCFVGWKRRRVLSVMLAVVSLCGLAVLTGCGAGVRPLNSQISTVTVTATSGTVTQTSTFTLAVKQ